MAAGDWRDRKHEEVFESTLRGLQNRRRNDAAFSLDELRSSLEHLYILEGNDWLGRGELGDIVTSATIAAHERFLHDWLAESAGEFRTGGGNPL